MHSASKAPTFLARGVAGGAAAVSAVSIAERLAFGAQDLESAAEGEGSLLEGLVVNDWVCAELCDADGELHYTTRIQPGNTEKCVRCPTICAISNGSLVERGTGNLKYSTYARTHSSQPGITYHVVPVTAKMEGSELVSDDIHATNVFAPLTDLEIFAINFKRSDGLKVQKQIYRCAEGVKSKVGNWYFIMSNSSGKIGGHAFFDTSGKFQQITPSDAKLHIPKDSVALCMATPPMVKLFQVKGNDTGFTAMTTKEKVKPKTFVEYVEHLHHSVASTAEYDGTWHGAELLKFIWLLNGSPWCEGCAEAAHLNARVRIGGQATEPRDGRRRLDDITLERDVKKTSNGDDWVAKVKISIGHDHLTSPGAKTLAHVTSVHEFVSPQAGSPLTFKGLSFVDGGQGGTAPADQFHYDYRMLPLTEWGCTTYSPADVSAPLKDCRIHPVFGNVMRGVGSQVKGASDAERSTAYARLAERHPTDDVIRQAIANGKPVAKIDTNTLPPDTNVEALGAKGHESTVLRREELSSKHPQILDDLPDTNIRHIDSALIDVDTNPKTAPDYWKQSSAPLYTRPSALDSAWGLRVARSVGDLAETDFDRLRDILSTMSNVEIERALLEAQKARGPA